jgi:hypothetical protein
MKYNEIKQYMDECWTINDKALKDVLALAKAHIDEVAEQDPMALIDDICANGHITFPPHIVQLATAAMAAAAAGAAFDEARFAFEKECGEPPHVGASAKDWSAMENRKPTVLGMPRVEEN